jgi:hypothetical protein
MTYPRNVDIETPEADAAEQWTDAFPDDEEGAQSRPEVAIETPEADAQEQSQFVGGEDEYR